MRILATLLLILAAAVGGSGPASADQTAAGGDGPQATMEYLLDAAAKDFLKYGPDPTAFRNVRFGVIEAEGEASLYLVCGEVQAAAGRDAGQWIEFATLKTSGYEQWLGMQGGGYCKRPGTTWEAKDLSAELQRRVEESRLEAAPAR